MLRRLRLGCDLILLLTVAVSACLALFVNLSMAMFAVVVIVDGGAYVSGLA